VLHLARVPDDARCVKSTVRSGLELISDIDEIHSILCSENN
jgi:hypothetical protein